MSIEQEDNLVHSSQYDARFCIALQHARAGTHLKAMKRKLKIDFGPIPALLCIAFLHTSGHGKSQSYEYFRITQAQCNACILAS